jgi:sulfonate transport system ATP-binding protein
MNLDAALSPLQIAPRVRSVQWNDGPAGASLNARELSKAFGERRVLEGLSLQVRAGESVAIVGRSGCGKSNLLRLLAGLDCVDRGEIFFNDGLVRGTHERCRVMFQESRLLPWKRVLGNVALGLPREHQDRAREALAAVGLSGRERDWPAVLSGGQQQRVALARALASHPDLLLLDEPLGALDALTRLEMQALIERLWREVGFTMIVVTHDVEEAIALADRVLVMDQGRWALDVRIHLPRARDRADPEFARHRKEILSAILGSAPWSPGKPPEFHL